MLHNRILRPDDPRPGDKGENETLQPFANLHPKRRRSRMDGEVEFDSDSFADFQSGLFPTTLMQGVDEGKLGLPGHEQGARFRSVERKLTLSLEFPGGARL